MSEQAAESTATEGAETSKDKEAVELPNLGDAAFGQLMDALAPSEGDGEAAAGEAAAGAAAGGDGSAAPAGEGKPAEGGEPAAPADGAAGDSGVAPTTGADGKPVSGDASGAGATEAKADPGAGDRPAEWTASAEELTPKLGELSTALEENIAKSYHEETLAEIREEHARYFDELEKHPRLLVGTEVPRIDGKEGMETLRDANDAREWQEAVKSILVEEVRSRTTAKLEENNDYLTTIHQSIELFQNNADLVPGTKEFDVELANKFATFVKDFELRDDDKKLLGYSVPVQPIINQLRTDLAAARAATKPAEGAAAPASSNDTKPSAQQTTSPEDAPQAGITSKAGESSEGKDDFSTLFGTIHPDLRDLRI